MLVYGDFEAWLECDGEKMSVYDAKLDPASREVSCFLLAEEGKVSSIVFISLSTVEPLLMVNIGNIRRSRYTGKIGAAESSLQLTLSSMVSRSPESSYMGMERRFVRG